MYPTTSDGLIILIKKFKSFFWTNHAQISFMERIKVHNYGVLFECCRSNEMVGGSLLLITRERRPSYITQKIFIRICADFSQWLTLFAGRDARRHGKNLTKLSWVWVWLNEMVRNLSIKINLILMLGFLVWLTRPYAGVFFVGHTWTNWLH